MKPQVMPGDTIARRDESRWQTYKKWVGYLAIFVAMTCTTLGCNNGGGAAGPSKSDVKTAYSAMMSGFGYAPAAYFATYSGTGPYTSPYSNGGSIVATYTSSTNPSSGPWSVTGTITFTNWVDTMSGYTINGTISLSESINAIEGTYPETITETMTSNLTPTGGPISTLDCNISETITYTTSSNINITINSGTVTANGYQYSLISILF